MEELSGLFNRNLIVHLHTFCCQLNVLSWAPDYHSPVLLQYKEHRVAAAKFGVFGNNFETTGKQEKRLGATCLKTILASILSVLLDLASSNQTLACSPSLNPCPLCLPL